MTTARALEHARVVLSACLQGRRDLMEQATRRLSPDHFPDLQLKNLYVIAQRYFDTAAAVVTRNALADMLSSSGADAGTVALYLETFDALVRVTPQDHEFRWSLVALQDARAFELTGTAIASGLEQLQGTADPPKHLVEAKPHERARAVIMESFSRIDKELNLADSPEGDVTKERDEILEDYAGRVSARVAGRSGVRFGIADLDVRTSGAQNGDLILVCGYTSVGKSQLCAQIAWDVAVLQGLNVYFATSETIRAQVRRRLVSRHSRQPQFGIPGGLNTRDLKAGTLTDQGVEQLRVVVDDLSTGPYGRLHLAQIPRGATIGTLESRLHQVQRSWSVDLVIVDYLALMSSERKRDAAWSELSDMVKQAKQLCTTFADGRGVPMISPWQMSRQAYERALKSGSYQLSDLSETAEAEKSSDLVVSALRTDQDDTGRAVELRMQILKNRDGEVSSSIPLAGDYTTSFFHAPRQSQSMADLLDT